MPLLLLGSFRNQDVDGQTTGDPPADSLRIFIGEREKAKSTTGVPKTFRIVAFSDPNDLLSYRIPEWIANDTLYPPDTFVNVTTSVTRTGWTIPFLGQFADPIQAHRGYGQDERVLDLMKRRTDAGRMREVFGSLQRHGIEAGTFIMVGYDGETLEDLEATVDYLKDAAPDTFLTTVAYPIKGTEYYDHVADRLEPDLAWETGSDRDLRVVGSGSPRYYRHAIRWMVNEVALARWRGGGVMGLVRWLKTALGARLGRLGMRWAKGPV